MSNSEPGAGTRVKDVRVSDDALSVDLADGRTIIVPLAWYPRLLHATPEQRANWKVAGAGFGIHWPEIDEDLSTDGLLRGLRAPRGSFTHSLMKASVSQMTRLMAAELSPRIRVNAVLPGAIETASFRTWLEQMPEQVLEQMISATPMRRNGTPEDIAAAVLYFASPASSWVTGKLLDVDGGVPGPLFPSPQPDL